MMSSQRPRRTTNGSNPEPAPRRPNGPINGAGVEDRTRAERFEDEKNRIIESCFLKKEDDGHFAESYITHIPVLEDASSPSAPPPPSSAPGNKKPRVIIVSVRRSGRVRLHKARENSNQSFSIGKTWILDHLSAIQSYTGGMPESPEEQEKMVWAGDTGMLITIQKPYFWKAGSQKEKDFFIGSLVKIYKKYTAGKVPDLKGFTPQEIAVFTPPPNGIRPRTPQTGNRPSPIPSPAIMPPPSAASTPSMASDPTGLSLRPPSAPRESRPRYQDPASSQETLSSTHQEFQTPPPPLPSARAPSRERRSPRAPLGPPSQAVTPQASQEFRPPPAPMRSPERSRMDAARSPARTPLNPPIRSAARSPSRGEPPSLPPPEALPERRRPPIEANDEQMVESPDQYQKEPDIPSDVVSPMSPDDETSHNEEIHRPGLGPMIKKKSTKDIANNFRKAAAAANAFKPRIGGAGERLRMEANKPAGPAADGIHGVFPAPSEPPKSPLPATPSFAPQISTPDMKTEDPIDSRTATPSLVPESLSVSRGAPKTDDSSANPEQTKVIAEPQEQKKKKAPQSNYATYARSLGIDPCILEGRTADFEDVFEDYGWADDAKTRPTMEQMTTDMHRDLARLEAGDFTGILEANEERMAVVRDLLQKTMHECDELDNLLTLYNVELGTLHEDIAYIEAQSQGLQVQTANQRLLHTELKNLLNTISIPTEVLEPLRNAPLARPDGIEQVEQSLIVLFKALLTIDPTLRHHGRALSADGQATDDGTSVDALDIEISRMKAVQDQKQKYMDYNERFIFRFKDHMRAQIMTFESTTRSELSRPRQSATASKIDLRARDSARASLWQYSPLILYVREVSRDQWEVLISQYVKVSKGLYQSEIRDNFADWKNIIKKPTGEHEEVLFTTQEKENESGSLVGRKLTVKRSKTLRDTPRTDINAKTADGKVPGYEAFAGALFDTSSSVVFEQNFISDFFHLSSLGPSEFADIVAKAPPNARQGSDLAKFRQFDPDRNMAKQLSSVMDDIFSNWSTDIQGYVDFVVTQDPLQGVGVLFALETKMVELEDSNQEYVVNSLQQIHSRLSIRFDRFVEEQIRGIEDTKVKIKKRKGVISFIRVFPYFVAVIEQMLPTPRANNYEIREKVNSVYDRVNRSMFESLKFIAKESPVVMAGQKSQGQTGGESEDKEVLNYHILLIQNMNHYSEEIQPQGNPTLEEWKVSADREMAEHMNLYVSAVIRRPLGKLLDSIESIEALLAATPSEPPSAISAKASHSRSIFKKILSDYEAKDVRHKIDALKKRVEKHFGEADDPGLSRNLVMKVLQECEERYVDVLIRTNRIVRDVYEGELEVEFKREDIHGAFRRN